MSERKAEEATRKLGDALRRFGEVLDAHGADADILRDAAIQRFEFTYELFWKAVKARFEANGRAVGGSPRAVLAAAYGAGWFDDEQVFERMMKDRNLTVHTYDEAVARAVAERLPDYHEAMRRAFAQRDAWR